MLSLGPKMTHLPILSKIRIFLKIPNSSFYALLNASHQVLFQENIMNRFREKFEKVNFGPQNDPILPYFRHNKNSKSKTIPFIHF